MKCGQIDGLLAKLYLFFEGDEIKKHQPRFIRRIFFDKKLKAIPLVELNNKRFIISINDNEAAACFIALRKPDLYKVQQGSAKTVSLHDVTDCKSAYFDGRKT